MGSSGFLGNRLVRHFSSQGAFVVGFSRRGCEADLSVMVDLSSHAAVDRLQQVAGDGLAPDVVVHAASKQPGSGKDAEFVFANVYTTQRLVEGLADYPPQKLIYTSTQSVYQRPASLPVYEDTPAGGAMPYSATKRWSEQLLEAMADVSEVTVLRLPSLYGAGQADSFIDGLARTALRGDPIELFSKGELIRDALHVSDVVKAIGACVNRPAERGYTVMNLGCGRDITTLEYAEALVSALGSASKIVPVERRASQVDLYANIERARRLIGFEPMTLSESMTEYANELRA
jgi:nucleoside-diphosphate-sugar epimerase